MKLTDIAKIVMGSPGIAALATTAGDCDYVSLKGFDRCTILINVDNGQTVTGGAITLKQAQAVAGTNEKALGFSKMMANLDCAASDAMTETAVTSDTFTTSTTNDKNQLYAIEVKASDLDVDGGFDCLRVDGLLMANAVASVLYVLHGCRNNPPSASAIID